jgi:nucleoside-diphosphate-sugar epimerase
MKDDAIIAATDLVLVTGANGFIGAKVVEKLLECGCRRIRCFVRPSSSRDRLNRILADNREADVEIVEGNLLSKPDCGRAARGVSVVYNLVAGMEKSFPGCFLNSVVTLRNLLDALSEQESHRRIVHVSSMAVYSNVSLRRGAALDESCEHESHFMERFEGYCYGKVKQEELLVEYGMTRGIPYVIVRPGVPYGPGVKSPIHARIGIDTFGLFLHLGGSNRLPLTQIDNCATAIALAGLRPNIEGRALNVVDDDLPTSRAFLRLYKKHVHRFRSIYVPYWLFRMFCRAWERYSYWSGNQLPPAFNRRKCAALWKGNTYPNQRLKDSLGWSPRITFDQAATEYFTHLRESRRG